METAKNNFKSGTFVRAEANTDFEYKYFLPELLPDSIDFTDPNIVILLEEATQKLGELNAYSKLIPDVDFFIKMHEVKEATQSSRIEGTRTKIDEAVMKKEDISPERRDDWQEVQNYIKAMNYAIESLKSLPLATRLIKETHAVLLQGVRGENKTPGETRHSQNWIGGATIRDARFVPPIHTEIERYLNDLDHYWNDKALTTPILVKAAISHYQFETVHPFLDGNGRLGRLIVVLYLISKGKLDKPVLYLSDYFVKNREQYYEALDAVRFSNDIEHWIKFFLVAVLETAKKSCKTLQKIIELRENDREKIATLGKRVPKATELLNNMYSRPIVSIKEAAEMIDLSQTAASDLVSKLVEVNILQENTGYSRNRVYSYRRYLELFS